MIIGDSCDMCVGVGVFIFVIGDNDNDNGSCTGCVHSFKCVSSICVTFNCVSFICMAFVGVKNVVLEMIKHEMGIDHYYISATRTVLIRVDKNTIYIPLFIGKA